MADTVRDLRGRYPFVYLGGDPAEEASIAPVLAGVLDARLTVQLPTDTPDVGVLATVSGATEDTMSFALEGVATDSVVVPVFRGRDNTDMLAESPGSWVLVDEECDLSELDGIAEGALQLHPMCLRLVQPPPRLLVRTRSTSSYADDMTPDTTPAAGTASALVAVEDGHNVSVSCDGSALTLTAAAGAGLGAFASSAAGSLYADLDSFDELRASGLRSINGRTGKISIGGGGVVAVSTPGDPPGTVVIHVNALGGGAGE